MNLWDQRINAHFLLFKTATFSLSCSCFSFSSVCGTHSSSLQWEAKGQMDYSLSKRQFILCRLQKPKSFQTPGKCNHSIDLIFYVMSLSTAMAGHFSKNLFISAREVEMLCYCYSFCSRLCLHRLCGPWHTSLPNNKLRTASDVSTWVTYCVHCMFELLCRSLYHFLYICLKCISKISCYFIVSGYHIECRM